MSNVVNNVVKSIFLYRVYHQLQANTFGYPFMAVKLFYFNSSHQFETYINEWC